MFNNNNNYNSRGVPEFMAYGGTPVGIPKGAVPQHATGRAVPTWSLGQQNQTSTFTQPTQFAQNNTQANDGNNLPFSFDDIYYSQNDNSGNTLYKGTADHEGGFSNRANDLGGATNYGITQTSLNEYNSWNSPLKKGYKFPQNVRLLTPEQSKQILANIVNSLGANEISPFNDLLSQKRMSRYFNSVDKYPQQNINNLNGWYNRVKSYYSNPLEFDKLYKNKVDYYILRKYPQYYNGR